MKILVAAASYASNMSGIQRHACNVVRCLLRQQEVSFVHLVIAPWQRRLVQAAGITQDARLSTHIAEMTPSSLSRNLWHYRELPKLADRLAVDLVHLTYPVPVNAKTFNCPTVVTLHDMYPYEIPMNFGFPKFIFNRLILKAMSSQRRCHRLRLRHYALTPEAILIARRVAKGCSHLQLRRGAARMLNAVANSGVDRPAILTLRRATSPQQESSSSDPDL